MRTATTRAKNRPKPGKGGGRRPSSPPRRRTPRLLLAAPWVAAAAVVVAAVVSVSNVDNSGGGARSASAGAFVGGDLHSLVVDPARPQRLFVGGHQSAATSTDGGRTWVQVASLRDADAMGWAFLGDEVWMGGHPGLRRSTGDGSFEPAGGELSSIDVHALGGAGGVLYAASPGRGVLASTDEGRTWQVRSAEAGRRFMGGIVVDPAEGEHLLAPDMQAGVVESRDGGRTWRPLGSPGMAMAVTAVGGDTGHLIVAGGEGAARSTDGGRTWQAIEMPDKATLIAAADDTTLYAAALDGDTARVFRSTDSAGTWRLLNP